MQPTRNSFRLTAPESSKNTAFGPTLMGLALAAGGGFICYLKLEDFVAGKDTNPTVIKALLMVFFGVLLSTMSIWRLIKGENLILLQNDHIDAPGQMPQISYASILAVQHVAIHSWDFVVLAVDRPMNDPASQKGRKRAFNMGLVLTDNDVPLWVAQSGWLASELCKQIEERLHRSPERVAA